MNKEINDGHYLELMDRLHVIMCNLEDHCLEHPLAKQDKEIKFKIEYALGQISDAYQEVGSKSFKNGDKKDAISKVIFRRRKKSKD